MEDATTDHATPETRERTGSPAEPLDPRIVPLRQAVGGMMTAVVALFALFALTANLAVTGPTLTGAMIRLALWLAGVGALAWCARRWPVLAYRHTSYRVDELGLEIRRGVVWRTIVYVPRSRIQHTDVSQGPLERRYGLGTLVVYTAGTDYARVSLPGLEHETALRIRERLLPAGESGAV